MIPRAEDYFRITHWALTNKEQTQSMLSLNPNYEIHHNLGGAVAIRRKLTEKDLEGEFGKYVHGQARKLKRIDGKEMTI